MKCSTFFCIALAFAAQAQVPTGVWIYPSSTGDLLYQLDERGQRIADFSGCGYRAGREPLPEVNAVIAPARWVTVEANPSEDDDTARVQAAIDTVASMARDEHGWRGVVALSAGEFRLADSLHISTSGIILKGVNHSPTDGTRLRGTSARQYVLIDVTGPDTRHLTPGTTHDLIQPLVPAGTRTFAVESTAGLAIGDSVIVKRPSTVPWISDLGMDQLGVASGGTEDVQPWAEGTRDVAFDRVITRIDGPWITVDEPLPQTFEARYGGGQVSAYTWPDRLEQIGIEDLYGFSDYTTETDEAHAWTFIEMGNVQHAWVRRITAQYFGNSAVQVADGGKWLTVTDCECLDPISIITGSRRYSFDNEGAELSLFVNNVARQGRHDFVLGSLVPGPNAFVDCTAETAYADAGPHHRWSVGALFDNVTVGGNELNAQNRGNLGTGHGWAGAYMTVWNCVAAGFRVRNPPTARNWLIGSIGDLLPSASPVGDDPEGTYDSSGPEGIGRHVYPHSLYYGQLQQRLKWPGSEFREIWLGDVDQFGDRRREAVDCDPTWLTEVQKIDSVPAEARFDTLAAGPRRAFTFTFALDAGETVVAASLALSLQSTGTSTETSILLDSLTNERAFPSLERSLEAKSTPITGTVEVSPELLSDGQLNVALGPDMAVDFAMLHLQVQRQRSTSQTISLLPEADAYVRGGENYADQNFGTPKTLNARDTTISSAKRESYFRWDLTGIPGVITEAKVNLTVVTSNQPGSENGVAFVHDDSWEEKAITFNNKPNADNVFAQWLPVAGQAVAFDVTSLCLKEIAGDGKLSLRVQSTGDYGSLSTVTYASRENLDDFLRPRLILTLTDPPETIDDWSKTHFEESDPRSDPSMDPDADAWTNEEEYVFGTLPTLPDAPPLSSQIDADGIIHLSFLAKLASGRGYAGRVRHYAVEMSRDLADEGSWTVLPGASNVIGNNKVVSLALPLTLTPEKRFFRLRAWLK